jgi:hypothetical protein
MVANPAWGLSASDLLQRSIPEKPPPAALQNGSVIKKSRWIARS